MKDKDSYSLFCLKISIYFIICRSWINSKIFDRNKGLLFEMLECLYILDAFLDVVIVYIHV